MIKCTKCALPWLLNKHIASSTRKYRNSGARNMSLILHFKSVETYWEEIYNHCTLFLTLYQISTALVSGGSSVVNRVEGGLDLISGSILKTVSV